MSYKTKNAIEAAMEGNASAFRDTVEDILMDKVRDAVELKKIEVASMFMSSDELDEDVELDESKFRSGIEDSGPLAKKWMETDGNLKVGNIELIRSKDKRDKVHTIKKNGKYAGTFSLDTDDDMWVLNYREKPGGRETDAAVGDIDGIVKIMKQVKV